MTRNATRVNRVKLTNTGYHFNTECGHTEEIETHIHGKLSIKRNSNGKVERISMISRGTA